MATEAGLNVLCYDKLLTGACYETMGDMHDQDGKSGWRSGHQSRLPPLVQKMLYVD